MNTTELPAMIRACVDGGTRPVSLSEIKARAEQQGSAVRRVPMRRRSRLAVAASGVAAAGIAGAVVASQLGGAATAGSRTVLTAAVVRQVAAASWAAMTSGQADIEWTGSGQPSVTQDISFDGANYNDVLNAGVPTQIKTEPNGGISRTGESINRVVDGHLYHYPAIVAKPKPHFVSGWMWINASGAGQPLSIPDPRSLLDVLSPSAGFVIDGSTTVNGVALQHLHATTPNAVPLSPWDEIIDSEPDNPQVSALDLWIDPSDVVVKAQITVTGTDGQGNAQSVSVTVTFSQIGQPLAITVPSPIVTTLGGRS